MPAIVAHRVSQTERIHQIVHLLETSRHPVPIAQSRELAMEILRHGPEVEVLSPDSLRAEVRTLLIQSLRHYPAQ